MTNDRPLPSVLDLSDVPARMLRNFVARYEDGGVQPHPVTSFVDERGRACVVGAFSGARSLEEFAGTEACRTFLQGPLVEVSRLFEDGRVTAPEVYDACLMELVRRGARRRARREAESEPARVTRAS